MTASVRRIRLAAPLVLVLAAPLTPVHAQTPVPPGPAPQVPPSAVAPVPAVPTADPAPAAAPAVAPPADLARPDGVAPPRRLPPASPVAPPPRSFEDKKVAVLQGLDKITARTSTFTVPVGQAGGFGLLSVTVRACRKTPPIDPPESAAFVEIVEQKPGEPAQRRFSGWMFASSPALSAMEHPVYDVWVVDCRNDSTSSSSSGAQ